MEFKDYYKILGVEKKADKDAIRKAYRKLAKQYHPDANKGDATAEEKFKDITEAYEVLSNPEKRREYDQISSNWGAYRGRAGGRPRPGGEYQNVNDIFSNVGGFSDFFNSFFSGFGGETRGGDPRGFGGDPTGFGGARTRDFRGATGGRPAKGGDYEGKLHISLDEAYSGIDKRIKAGGKTLRVTIPPGVEDGRRLRIRNQGAPGKNGGPRGDLYLTVRVVEHALFERKGDDLYYDLDVDLYDAVLGGRAVLETLGGKKVSVTIAPETQNGKVLRMRGYGMPKADGSAGDLYLRVNVMVPENLTESEKELFRKLAEFRR
jgi:curved DNA-binding protein